MLSLSCSHPEVDPPKLTYTIPEFENNNQLSSNAPEEELNALTVEESNQSYYRSHPVLPSFLTRQDVPSASPFGAVASGADGVGRSSSFRSSSSLFGNPSAVAGMRKFQSFGNKSANRSSSRSPTSFKSPGNRATASRTPPPDLSPSFSKKVGPTSILGQRAFALSASFVNGKDIHYRPYATCSGNTSVTNSTVTDSRDDGKGAGPSEREEVNRKHEKEEAYSNSECSSVLSFSSLSIRSKSDIAEEDENEGDDDFAIGDSGSDEDDDVDEDEDGGEESDQGESSDIAQQGELVQVTKEESFEELCILDLPPEIMVEVFRYLDEKSFLCVQRVCSYWRELTFSPWLWSKRCESKWVLICGMISKCEATCHEMIAEFRLPKKYSRRVQFLQETVGELSQHARDRVTNHGKSHFNIDCYFVLVDILQQQLEDTVAILGKIIMCRSPLTVNFDILDISLRRYFKQLDAMFPIREVEEIAPKGAEDTDEAASSEKPVSQKIIKEAEIIAHPSSVITDPAARELWEANVGKDKHACHFLWFYENVLLKRFPCIKDNVRFRNFFNFFVNFPRDDLLTVYKWSVITDQFGPFNQFAQNFDKYACNEGFLGLINAVEAEEQLQETNKFLLRFSRKEPEKLTVSFKIKRRDQVIVRHRRKPLGEPIDLFISQHFNRSDFMPVSKKLGDTATLIDRLDVYCEQMGYLIENGTFEKEPYSSGWEHD